MAFSDENQKAVNMLDVMLRDNHAFQKVPLILDGYKSWYALLLGSLVLIAGPDEITFASTQYDATNDSAEMVAFTPSLLTHVTVANASDDSATVCTRTIPRRTIQALSLEIYERHDGDPFGQRREFWPGTLRLTLEYPTLTAPVKITTRLQSPYRPDEPTPGMVLLDGLREDLKRSTSI